LVDAFILILADHPTSLDDYSIYFQKTIFRKFSFLNSKDIGASVIAAGLALDCPRYSGGRYAEYEIEGAAAKIKLPKYCR
jgi:endonuclease YncB( thermonuclease family)